MSRVPLTPYLNPHAAEPIGDVRTMYDGRLSPELAATTFRNIDRLFPTRVIRRGAAVAPLPPAAHQLSAMRCTSGGTTYSLDDYMRVNRVTGLLVLDDGRVAFERYALGATASTRSMSMSMAKSVTATLIGVAVHEGRIRAITDQVTKYVPSLKGSAYDGVTVRDVLMMASGVKWNETYTDPASDRRHLLDAQIAQQPGAALALMASLPRAAAPGSVWNYSTGETLVAAELLRGAISMPLSQYLSDRIWKPLGMESDASWWLDSPEGHEIGGSGISATLRDYARFGLFIMRDGMIDGHRVLPEGWVLAAGSPKTLTTGTTVPYGYMWWPAEARSGSTNAGAFTAQGIFGQYLYINPHHHVVIAQWSAQTKPTGGDVANPEDCFAALTDSVRAGRR